MRDTHVSERQVITYVISTGCDHVGFSTTSLSYNEQRSWRKALEIMYGHGIYIGTKEGSPKL